MKRVEKEIKRYETFYEANDGTLFNSEEECAKYEKTARAVIHGRFKDTFGYNYDKGNGVTADRLYLLNFSGEDELSSFYPKDQTELDTLNLFMKEHCGDYIGSEYIGRRLFFVCYDGDYSFLGDEAEIRAKINWDIECVKNNYIPKCGSCMFFDKENLRCNNNKSKDYSRATQEYYAACHVYEEKK